MMFWEYAARMFEKRWATPGEMACALDNRTIQTRALEIIDEALVGLLDTPDGRLIISMPPQEGKSQRASRRFPLWALVQNPDLRIAIASYEHGVARRWGRAIRDDITTHSAMLGLSVRSDLSAQHEWQLTDHEGGVYSTGVGGALTGRPVDLAIIDDPIKDREQANSEVYRERVWSWWTDVMATRLAPGAPVVLILTRWHHDDLAGRLLAAEDGHLWKVINIPAECDDEEKDPLRRKIGEFMESARRRTSKQWRAIKIRSGSFTWASLYQGKPTPDKGNLFPLDGWKRYEHPLWVVRENGAHIIPNLHLDDDAEMVQSWDFTFKDTKSSDYVVGQVWMRKGPDAYLLYQVRKKAGFAESVQMIKDVTAMWPQAIAKLVEDKANGPAIINALHRQIGGMIPVEPEGSKYARASAITPFRESGNIWLPDPVACDAPWITDLTEEARLFPQGANDDTVDAMSQAVHRLLIVPIMEGETITEEDLFEDDLELDWATAY